MHHVSLQRCISMIGLHSITWLETQCYSRVVHYITKRYVHCTMLWSATLAVTLQGIHAWPSYTAACMPEHHCHRMGHGAGDDGEPPEEPASESANSNQGSLHDETAAMVTRVLDDSSTDGDGQQPDGQPVSPKRLFQIVSGACRATEWAAGSFCQTSSRLPASGPQGRVISVRKINWPFISLHGVAGGQRLPLALPSA